LHSKKIISMRGNGNGYRTGTHSMRPINEDHEADRNAHRPDSHGRIIKEEPNFEVSGVLAEEQNQRNGIPLTFSIAIDAAAPEQDESDWRLFEFQGESDCGSHRLVGNSCFLLGSDTRLSNTASEDDMSFIALRDESCSRQHAVIQFRKRDRVKPYLMDLNSSNGTVLNGSRIEPGRYIELRHQDVLEFGKLRREFVLINAKES